MLAAIFLAWLAMTAEEMIMFKRMSLVFDLRKSVDGREQCATLQVAHGRELFVIASSQGKARAALEKEARLHIGKSIDTESHGGARCVIGCVDGHVLVLGWSHDTGEYYVSVCGSDRTLASFTYGGMETVDKAREYMRKYASDCFQGVAWENR